MNLDPEEASAKYIALRQALGDAGLIKTVCPIYAGFRRNRVQFIGSGVLLRIADEPFLITAAHVIDAVASDHFFLGLGSQVYEIDVSVSMTRVPDGADRSQDRLDVAVCYLSPSHVEHLSPDEFVELESIYRVPLIPEAGVHLAVGFPGSRQPKQLRGRDLSGIGATIACVSRSADEHRQLGLDPIMSLSLRYDRTALWSETGYGLGVQPRGMSGGPVWFAPDGLHDTVAPRLLLAGVLIEWVHGKREILATRVPVALSVIARDRPKLQALVQPWLE